LDQAPAGQALEGGDLMADRRLHVPEPRGGAAERSLVCHGFERDQMTKLDARPPLARHARCDARTAVSSARPPAPNMSLTKGGEGGRGGGPPGRTAPGGLDPPPFWLPARRSPS